MYILNGVYKRNKEAIEKEILSIKRNAKTHQRKEILDYIRIETVATDLDINTQFINFRNGMFDLINFRLIEHSPRFFTTCQIHAYYLSDKEIIRNENIESFLDDVTCNEKIPLYMSPRKRTLLQIIGYCMTYRVDMQKAFILYRTFSKKSVKALL